MLLLILPTISWAVPAVTTGSADPCTVANALSTLIPGAQWSLANNDYATFAFVGASTFTAPSPAAVTAQINTCHTNQTTLSAETVELSTTTTALSALYPSLLSNPTTSQMAQADVMNSRLNIIRNDLGK